jgi:hypothetical protein
VGAAPCVQQAHRFLLAPLRERPPDDLLLRALPPDDFREPPLLDALRAPPRELPDIFFRERLPAAFRAPAERDLPEDFRDRAAELLRARPLPLRDGPFLPPPVSPVAPSLIPAPSSTSSSMMRSSESISPRDML